MEKEGLEKMKRMAQIFRKQGMIWILVLVVISGVSLCLHMGRVHAYLTDKDELVNTMVIGKNEIILEEKPTLVISIHQNKYPSKAQRGAQVFYNQSSINGKAFALCLQERLNALYKDQGVKGRKASTGDFFMLNITQSPSVLIECGFLSSPLDEKLLITNAWQKALAENIADGVMAYLSDGVS